jgi:hypothetical protein
VLGLLLKDIRLGLPSRFSPPRDFWPASPSSSADEKPPDSTSATEDCRDDDLGEDTDSSSSKGTSSSGASMLVTWGALVLVAARSPGMVNCIDLTCYLLT